MREIGRGWMLVGLLLAVALSVPSFGQVSLTTVADTVYSANGSPAQGSVVVSWNAFTTAAGNAVAAGTASAVLGSNGSLSIALAPNAGATPTGSYYTAIFHLSDGTTSRQYWVIPASGPVKLAAVQNQVLPTSVAMQTVSKAYVDQAIAAAVTTGVTPNATSTPAYVQKTGDTMTGPLTLPGDPVAALQAADKHYVDASVAAVGGGAATKVSTLPTAAQTVVQPSGTQLEVNALNGTLDATGFLTGNGNNGIPNALASPGCANGCELSASQTYPGTEAFGTSGLPMSTHIEDHRGGASFEVRQDPLPAMSTSSVSSTVIQNTTRSAPQMAAVKPSAGLNSIMLSLTHNAMTGGSNQLPTDVENVPYGKANYGITSLVGNYYTQGQHVQNGDEVDCYAVGDCLAGGQFIRSSGGFRDESDEGTHPFDLQVSEDTRVFQGTCGSGCTTGATTLPVNPTVSGGTQGDGRFFVDLNPKNMITTGTITGFSSDYLQIENFSGTNFPVSTQVVLAAAAKSQAGNMSPGTVTLPIATSGLVAGYSTSTAALPKTSGVACVSDGGGFPNFETATYSVVDATHLQLTLNKVHKSGAVVAVGGLCGYGLEQTVDTTNPQGNVIRQVFPIVGSPTPTSVYTANAGTNNAMNGYASTSGYLNVSSPIVSATRSGNVVTLNFSQQFYVDVNGLSMTVSGMSDPSFNGTFPITTTGNYSLSYTDNGPDGTSTGGTVSFVSGGFAMYPMAEVLNVYDQATGSVDGVMTLAPNTVPWAPGDLVEEPHYFQEVVYGDMEYITQYMPRPVGYAASGKFYQGLLGPGARGWAVFNGTPSSSYVGGGGTHQIPGSAFLASGAWQNSIETDAGTNALLWVHCNLHTCNRWDSGYSLFSLDKAGAGQDFLNYEPQSSTATWLLGAATYSFSPSAFTADTINTKMINLNGVGLSTQNSGQVALTSNVSPAGATLTATNQFNGTAIPIAAYCPNASGTNPCLFPIGTSFAANSVGILAWQPAGFFQMQTYNNGSPIQIGGSAINTTASLMVNNGAAVNQLGNTCAANISLCVNPNANMTVDASGNVTALTYHETLRTPATSSAACAAGDFADDANFHYVCVATNTWKRVALSSF